MNHLRSLLTSRGVGSTILRQAGSPLRAQGSRPVSFPRLLSTSGPAGLRQPSANAHLFSKPQRLSIKNLFARQRRLLSGTKSRSAQASSSSTPADTSLSGRLKKLSREYGWSALGVYLALSALDFPFCFLAVRWLGTERIGRWEHAVVEFVKRAIPFQWPERWGGQGRLTNKKEEASEEAATAKGYDHGVKAALEQNDGERATLWTQLALAYAIHKSFIFLRVPLTAAVLPKVVKTLRGWGWNIGRRTPKVEKIASAVESSKKL